MSKTILITCGETSGEHHAARVVSEMKRIEPSCRVLSLGGEELEGSGAEITFPMHRYVFMGFAEVLANLPRILALERRIRSLLRSGRVDLFMPVDYPGLNLRLARYAHRHGVPVLYFISPQVWAWGKWRVERMRGSIDLMALILPFEEEIYRRAGIPAAFVGHPLLDEIDAANLPKEVPAANEPFTIVLFPGSRRQEVSRMLPPLLGAAGRLRARFPRAAFMLGIAPLMDEGDIHIPAAMRSYVKPTRAGLNALQEASLVIAVSGTVTLQSAISGTPTVVCYRTSAFTYLIGRLLVRIPWIAMPNILAGDRIVPELIQRDATAERIAAEAENLLLDAGRYRRVSERLLVLRDRLEGRGGAARVAEIALGMASGRSVNDIPGLSHRKRA
jgi:lipid-A-disaccharide synthase